MSNILRRNLFRCLLILRQMRCMSKGRICCTIGVCKKDYLPCKHGRKLQIWSFTKCQKNRQPRVAARPRPSTRSCSSISSISPCPIQTVSNGTAHPSKVGAHMENVFGQFVGVSRDQNPFALRHCSFNTPTATRNMTGKF